MTTQPLIKSLSRRIDPVSRSWGVVFGGTVIRLAFGFVASVLLARVLKPSDYGLYATLAAIAGLTAAVAELGLTNAAVRQISASWLSDPVSARMKGQAFVWLRVGTASIVAAGVAGAIISFPSLFPTLTDTHLLLLALIGIPAGALSGAASALLQATGRFGRLSLVLIINSALTALLALLLAASGSLSLVTALVVLGIGTSIASFLVARVWLPAGWRLTFPPWPVFVTKSRQLLRFGRWLWVANFLAMAAVQFDLLLLSRWSSGTTLGYYALALTLASKADVVNSSLHTVLLPAASSLHDRQAFAHYIRQALLRSALIGIALLPLFPLAHLLISFFYGASYEPAVPLFQLLLGAVLLDIFLTPLLLLLYPLDRPVLLAATEGLRLGTLIAAALWLVPLYGAPGAVYARLAARLVSAALPLTFLLVRLESSVTK